jgi:hypothetical protein
MRVEVEIMVGEGWVYFRFISISFHHQKIEKSHFTVLVRYLLLTFEAKKDSYDNAF